MEREVRYCTTEDGVRIAYCVEGEGPPLLIQNHFFESFTLEQMVPALLAFRLALGSGYKVIRLDHRGVGASQRVGLFLEDLNAATLVKDMVAVIEATSASGVNIYASGISAVIPMILAAEHPHLVKSLVIFGSYPGPTGSYPPAIVESFASLAEQNWNMAAQLFADMSGRRDFPDDAMNLGTLYVQSTSGEVVSKIFRENGKLDLSDKLRQVQARSLVLHRRNDQAFPMSEGQKIASYIPGARFKVLEGTANDEYLGDGQAILHAAHAFFDEDPDSRRSQHPPEPVGTAASAFRAVLFTDLVGHTEMMSRLGDDRGREVLREHEEITRKVLRQHGGTEVKTMGDGFMASFGSVTKAVECAVALQRAFAEHEGEALSVRVGLNAGEPIEEDGDLFGATVILASRIAAKAGGGEILVADTVRGLCSGKGFLFADRGEFVAKGFEEPLRVYEVSWRG